MGGLNARGGVGRCTLAGTPGPNEIIVCARFILLRRLAATTCQILVISEVLRRENYYPLFPLPRSGILGKGYLLAERICGRLFAG